MRILFALLIISLTLAPLNGQDKPIFISPLKIPLYLSGNFGEIRSDHFHSGIDIKTNGRTGYPVHAVEDGYVSRLKVQANGYGNTIYITHDNGYTSVYGHLDRYREDIARHVRDHQYRNKSFSVDIFPDKTQFRVKKDELIAYSGNSGNSSGPHLHFEIRKTAGQIPTNVLKYSLPVADKRAPVFYKVFIHPRGPKSFVSQKQDKAMYHLVSADGSYQIEKGRIPLVYGDIGISTEVFDFLDNAPNRCGVYTLELYCDGVLMYRHRMDEVPFSETRYINAHIDYDERITNNTKSHKLFRLPNNPLKIYEHMENEGIISINDAEIHDIKIIARDVAGNESQVNFKLKGMPADDFTTQQGTFTRMPYHVENLFSEEGIRLSIPAYALYEDLHFSFSRLPGPEALYSDVFCIHKKEVPLHRPFLLSIVPENLADDLTGKALIVSVDDNLNIASAGGGYKNGMVESEIRNFGKYSIAVDTIAPEIIPVNHNASGDYTGKSSIRFIIKDNLSGIEKYDGYIDNTWVLFEYDLKNNLISYAFDDRIKEKDTRHELELYVSDAKGNVTLYHTTFTR